MTLGARVLGGRYRVDDVIGHGGMAVVFRGTDMDLDRAVAIKVLREQLGSDPQFVERFRREARSAASLNHPNIIAVFDVGREDDVNFIVMELVNGEDLKDLILREGPIQPTRVISIGCQLAAALEYAHRRGIVHRDVKSQNVIVARDGQVKLGDFGIAVALGSRSLTQTGTVIGSAHYMSPEQIQGRPSVPASDVYGLGVVLYEAATGRLPFEAESAVAVARMHLDQPPRDPRELNRELPASLSDTIMIALRKEPRDRFQSAAELAAALRGQRMRDRERTAVAPIANGRATTGRAKEVASQPTVPWTLIEDAPPRNAPSGRIELRRRSAPSPRPPRKGGIGIGAFALAALVLAVAGATGAWLLASTPVIVTPRPTPAPVLTQSPAPAQALPTRPPAPTAAPAQASPTPVLPTATVRPTVAPKPTTPPTPIVQRVEVPGVVGKSEADAYRQLQQAGFSVEVREDRNPSAPNGMVIGQSPPPGTQLEQGRGVTITVGRPQRPPGPKPKANLVPNVEGMDEREARKTLQEAGFKVEVDEETAPGRKGQVIDQRPGAGDTVAPGSAVKITLGA